MRKIYIHIYWQGIVHKKLHLIQRSSTYFILFILLMSYCQFLQGQVGINTTSPELSAALDINSNNKGMLVPRMLQSERSAIGSPAQGLIVFQTDQTSGFYYYNNGWIYINSTGPQGPAGANGRNSMALTSVESMGANCANGGTRLQVGVDANGNNILESNEINNSLTRYICNGTNGRNTVAKTTTEPAGANCAKGGVKLEFGIDANGNNTLDVSEINAALTKYVCNGNTPGSFDHYIGEAFGGGVIFHLWKEGTVEHGLIVCQTGLVGNGGIWSNVSANANASSYWDGLTNCQNIVAQAGHTQSAAAQALSFVSNGQSDWYLPSFAEMNLLWVNYFNVSKTISMIGATQVPLFTFWTSTLDGSGQAFAFNMFTGVPQGLPTSTTLNILAIRKF